MLRICLLLMLLVPHLSYSASISPRTYNTLTEIQQQITEQPNTESVADLNVQLSELANDLEGNALGLALTYQAHAQLKSYEQKEAESQGFLIKALKLSGLKEDTTAQLRSMLAYSYFNQSDYKKAIAQLTIIINESKKPSANIYALLAASYYSLNDLKSGLPYIEQAIELTEKPKEGWLQMAFSGNYQAKNLKKAIHYVNLLVFNYPDKKDYWLQKAGIHQIIEDYPKAAATKELSYKKGLIEKESDFINLGQLLASQGNAYKVATVLEQTLKADTLKPSEKILNLQFQAWLQAKELTKARASLATLFDAYQDIDDGYQLLQYHIDAEEWQQADTLANHLLEMDLSKKQKGKVYLYLGMVKYRLGDERSALKILGKSTAFENTSSQAKSWMSYIKQMSS